MKDDRLREILSLFMQRGAIRRDNLEKIHGVSAEEAAEIAVYVDVWDRDAGGREILRINEQGEKILKAPQTLGEPVESPFPMEIEYAPDDLPPLPPAPPLPAPICESSAISIEAIRRALPVHDAPFPAAIIGAQVFNDERFYLVCEECLGALNGACQGATVVKDVRSIELVISERRDAAILGNGSKKEQIIALHQSGVTDIAQIVRRVGARPSYVAQVLQSAGLIAGYFDLYTTTPGNANVYTRFFRNVLSFKSVEASEESVKRIGRLFDYFERLGDRAGQHQAMILALTGYNRARWSGKMEESQVFKTWLDAH